jgi:hypothetical protein
MSPTWLAWRRRTAKWTRLLHIYGSMSSLAIVLFFAITGITLNLGSWRTRCACGVSDRK